ncbi:hypothetical protein Aab01nite_67240 [Paractinoplanes abujensis]|uniref:Uncharacterized protein n=1 Tax=Paractinoplanes abujensis TaxID=882441 RepID=A0A7W7CVN5_9ACTN|nr:hypothetical protein [Actinoplanes abujensis]MBB4695550.1 hypothetical protein [Actinoplanes abujensis]GID23134.1 hypothetical protein Aab01nite_67240 [Actinoplanes abujensis]
MAPPKPRGSPGKSEGADGASPIPTPHPAAGGMVSQENMVATTLAAGEIGRDRASTSGGQSTDGDATLSAARPNRDSPQAFVDNIVSNPRSLAGQSAHDIADQFTAAGYQVRVDQSTKRGTSQLSQQVRIEGHPEIANIQVHPGGGRHTPTGSPYWKISTSTQGRIWVIPNDFRGADELSGNVVRYDD